MFKMKNQGSGPLRMNAPLHQNVSTNEVYSIDPKTGNRVLTTTTTTPDQFIKGTPAPPPVVETKPPSDFNPTVSFREDCVGIKEGELSRSGQYRCDRKPKPSPPPGPDPQPVPGSQKIITGQGTPDQLIPGTTDTTTQVFERPTVMEPPVRGTVTNRQGRGKSGIGNINLPLPDLGFVRDIDLGRFVPNVSFRGLRNLVTGCKGGGCPEYYKR